MISKNLCWSNINAIFIFFTLTTPAILLAESINKAINLEDKNLTHVTFKRITPNEVDIKDNVLTFQVKNSSSFVLVPFENVREVNKISFQWKKNGTVNVKDAQHEETRQGDDAYLRVGLILEGKDTLMNPLAPRWVKTVRDTLRFPSDKMIYLTPGSRHQNGQHWKSPFSVDVEIIAVASKTNSDGWNISEYTFEDSQSVVGLWLMADGDNTESSFSSELKALILN